MGKSIAGNERLFAEKEISLTPEAQQFLHDMSAAGATGVLVGHQEHIVGGIGIADTLKTEVHESIKDTRSLGIKKVLMLTGDNKSVAQATAGGAGLDGIVAELLPEHKLEYIKGHKAAGEKIAMVGDGINDAPSLVEADVGIAMGAIGTDAAIEAADIALTGDDLSKVSRTNLIHNFLINLGYKWSLQGFQPHLSSSRSQKSGAFDSAGGEWVPGEGLAPSTFSFGAKGVGLAGLD